MGMWRGRGGGGGGRGGSIEGGCRGTYEVRVGPSQQGL